MSTPRERQLVEALEAALAWIDAVPSETVASLPVMPGFDRDEVDELVSKVKAERPTKTDNEVSFETEADILTSDIETIQTSSDDQFLKDYRMAYIRVHGRLPKITKSGSWYSMAAGSYRRADIIQMTQNLLSRL